MIHLINKLAARTDAVNSLPEKRSKVYEIYDTDLYEPAYIDLNVRRIQPLPKTHENISVHPRQYEDV